MKKVAIAAAAFFLGVTAVAVAAGPVFKEVKPQEFDPVKTNLTQSTWLKGIGCPTGAKQTADGSTVSGSLTAGGCPSGDAKDDKNAGLLLAKTGPTANFAIAYAELKDVKNATITELGYDLRKAGPASDDRGSHCGAGSPRFNVETSDGTWFIGCNSPPAAQTAGGDGWIRLRWTGSPTVSGFGPSGFGPITGNVQAVYLVMDEGQDTGPDNFGLSVLDNIDVNGTLVGKGPTEAN